MLNNPQNFVKLGKPFAGGVGDVVTGDKVIFADLDATVEGFVMDHAQLIYPLAMAMRDGSAVEAYMSTRNLSVDSSKCSSASHRAVATRVINQGEVLLADIDGKPEPQLT